MYMHTQMHVKHKFLCNLFILVLVALHHGRAHGSSGAGGFARTNRTHFVVNGRPFYSNGFNAYWLMYMASHLDGRSQVSSAFQQASSIGLTVVRTWAFSDGGYRPLQYSPGLYNEPVFQGLDFVISEARRNGMYLILSLVNNFQDFGGRRQYVEWAKREGQNLRCDDDFYRNDVVKSFYKNHVKTILTRVNTITGVAYKDDPTIFAWELINEARCQSDLSGRTLQAWIEEMAAHVKSIDSNHLLEIGLEGFYGNSLPERKQLNPGYEVGTDFIANNVVDGIDFATIHAYPDMWFPGSSEQTQLAFLRSWIQSHIQDATELLGRPLLIAEFGKSSRSRKFSSDLTAAARGRRIVDEREALYASVYNAIYASAICGGPCRGGLFWQLLAQGMDDSFRDGYEVIFSECPSLAKLISQQSLRIAELNGALKPSPNIPSHSHRHAYMHANRGNNTLDLHTIALLHSSSSSSNGSSQYLGSSAVI